MRLLLIRHGESVDNAAGLYAGSRDASLTAHGALQAGRLGARLAASSPALTHMFASPLRRAARTAEAVRDAQRSVAPSLAVVCAPELREKDFGSLEGVSFRGERPACDDAETAQSVRERAACFLDENLVPLLAADVAQETESVCAVVAHGILLSALAHVLFSRFAPGNIVLPAGPERNGLALDGPAPVLPSWSNTGYLEVVISAPSGALSDDIDWLRRRLCVERVNCTVHLQNLKKTRGGIGSAPFDERQRTMNHFFPRQPKPPQ